jgi:hypothetical protein
MFRLIKLAMYALVGYVLYELYQGMSADSAMGAGQRREGMPARSGQRDRLSSGQNVTSGGQGQRIETLDHDGGSVPHRVGRGVVSS